MGSAKSRGLRGNVVTWVRECVSPWVRGLRGSNIFLRGSIFVSRGTTFIC